jgi:GTP cyclohydrolase II
VRNDLLVERVAKRSLREANLDELNANKALELGASDRDFIAAASMLKQLGVSRVRLLTNNVEDLARLTAHGIEVAGCVSHVIVCHGEDNPPTKIDERCLSNRAE